ncbi:MAG: endonuclease/exonuclease/phosphatase [Alphaproteobacteria bacterium]|nr:endonuclease/exonuclease/phosphatase [Alphaproteobacteria bacterium]
MRRILPLILLLGCPEAPAPTGLPTPAPVPVPVPVPVPEPVPSVPLKIVAYNVESGGAEAETVAANVQTISGEAIWAFEECLNQDWLTMFAAAAADDASQTFQTVLGTTGFSDRLGLAYDTSQVTLESHEELASINIGGNGRAPLVGTFVHNETGVRFKLVVNHLWRTDAALRHQQASMLNTWAAGQTLPIVAVGDYNFDWAVTGGESDHDVGYDNMVAGGVYRWLRPATLVNTQCSGDSVLDFVFVAQGARDWTGVGDILLRGNVHCQPSDLRPDHRPVSAVFQLPLPAL